MTFGLFKAVGARERGERQKIGKYFWGNAPTKILLLNNGGCYFFNPAMYILVTQQERAILHAA